jgi:hypothetical protein
MNDIGSTIIWEEGSIDGGNGALVEQITNPVNGLIKAHEEDDLTDFFSTKLSDDECFNIMEMNVDLIKIDFKRISIKDNFAVVEASVFDGTKEYGQMYFLVNENEQYKIFDCTLQSSFLRIN